MKKTQLRFLLGAIVVMVVISLVVLCLQKKRGVSQNSETVCPPSTMLYSKDNGHVKFSFCYPQGWEALERERPLGSWYLSFSKPGETKTKTLYIQMQLSSHDLELDKRLFANHQATQAPQFKNEEKRVVLKDTPTEFHIFERVLSSHSQISNTITYYVVNPQTSPHQIMRFWFDYEDNAPLSDVREESQVFAEVIESFKWDKN